MRTNSPFRGILIVFALATMLLAMAVSSAGATLPLPLDLSDAPHSSPFDDGEGSHPFNKPSRSEVDPRIPDHYIVVLKDSVEHPGAVAETQTEQRNGELDLVYRSALKGYSAELSQEAVEALRKDPRVRYVVADTKVEALAQTVPTGIERTLDTENATADIDGQNDAPVNVDVAVIDTGIDFEHPDLNVVSRTNCVPAGEEIEVEECVDNSGIDGHGHGTHVAGTIGAIDNGEGVVGVAPGARLWGVRVLNSKGEGSTSWIVAGVDWVTAHSSQIEVANMSLGGFDLGGPDPLDEAVETSISSGVVYAVAAGNSAADAKEFHPANAPGAITVSALADYDGEAGGGAPYTCTVQGADDTLASFSNYGEVVDIAAPGVCIDSTAPMGGSTIGAEYATLSGTSMASPHVAGGAALLASKSNPNSKADVEAIRNTLVNGGSLNYDHTAPGPSSPLLYLGEAALGTEVSTGGATTVKAVTATVTGAVNPRGLKSTYTFEYGTDTKYGQSAPAPATELKAGTGFTRVIQALSGLTPRTTYHYRLVTTNEKGTFKGVDHTFTTYDVIFTTLATDVGEAKATLNGAVYRKEWPLGEKTTYKFEYGKTAAYGQTATAEYIQFEEPEEETEEEAVYGDDYTHAFATISGLDKSTTYHYRVVATNSHGTFAGGDQRFRTEVWKRQEAPETKEETQYLESVSCSSITFCAATGLTYTEMWNGTVWKMTSYPRGPVDAVHDVSCVSQTFCVAVGTEISGETPSPLLIKWNGEKWSAIEEPAFPEGLEGHLMSVSCATASACMAVGVYDVPRELTPGESPYFSMKWNGTAWTFVLTVPYLYTGFEPELPDVSCSSASDCYAVGTDTLRWNGSEWSLVSMPSPEMFLQSISCTSPEFCMAIGRYGGEETTARRWDGKSWTVVPMGAVARPGGESWLRSISCATPSSCTAVGHAVVSEWQGRPLTAHWDGQDWSHDEVDVNDGFAKSPDLAGVDCPTFGYCVAGGAHLFATRDYRVWKPSVMTDSASGLSGTTATLNASIDGHEMPTTYQFEYDTTEYKEGEGAHGAKAPASPESLGGGSGSIKVSKSIEGLTAKTTYHYRVVATNEEGTSYGNDRTFTTSVWSAQSTPNSQQTTIEDKLEAVSCASSSMCLGVGNDLYTGRAFVQAWNGSEWQATAATGIEGTLYGIKCNSTTACVAVGKTSAGAPKAVSLQFLIGKWIASNQTVPTPSGGTEAELRDVSCTATSACTAVGSYLKEGNRKTLAARWGGSEWQLQTSANPESGAAELLGVSCDSATSCTAVGKQGTSAPLAERWNGTSWSLSTVPKPEGALESALERVSCTSGSFCMAVGSNTVSSPAFGRKQLAAKWNGSSWSIVATSTPGGSKADALLSVSCASSSACSAVGRYVTASTSGDFAVTEQKTLAQSWGGSEWQLQSSPNPEGKKLPRLTGVSCTSSTACIAVGWARKGASEAETTTWGERYE